MGQLTARVARGRNTVAWIVCVAMVMSMVTLSTDVARAAETHQVCSSGCAFTSVQSAIDAATAGDTILIQPGTYTENVAIAIDLTLVGGGAGSTILDGNAAATVLSVAPGVSVSVEDLQLRNGHAEFGGGVLNEGNLTLERVMITGNTADDGGAGIYNTGALTVNASTIASNTGMLDRTGGIGGGGIASTGSSASATIVGSSITDNSLVRPGSDQRGGGGIASKSADLTLTDSVVADNSSGYSAGGIYVSGSTAEVTILRSTISGNVTGTDQGTGRGGGVDLRGSAQTTIVESTISGNTSASSGGGIHIDAPTTITNSTVSGNHAVSSGGGILANRSFTIVGTTIASNTADRFGGGVYAFGTIIVAENSVLADNAAPEGGPDCYSTLSSAAGEISLVEATADCAISGDGTVLTGTDPQLGSLADNGGPTRTHLPGEGSVLIDAGATDLSTDQRGEPRPSGAAPDLGAVEVQQVVLDTNPPTWTDPTLNVTSVHSSGFALEWSGAEDDTGIDSYDVMIDGAVVEVVDGSETSTTVSGLQSDTNYQVEIQALDAAGNRSTDGPTSQATTASQVSTGQLLPSPTDPDQGWQAELPVGLIDQARRDGELLLVASAGANSTTATLIPAVPIDLDLDLDGVEDIRATITLEPGPGNLPDAVLTVDRLTQPGPSQVQVVALIPLPDQLATELGQGTMVVGFGTTAPGGAAGGTLPASETIRASLDTLGGLSHRLALDFTTVGADNPLEFYVGAAESQRVVQGAEAANLLGMHVSPVPSHVSTTASITANEFADSDPEMVATWTWDAPTGEPEPDVTFAYLESDRRRKDTAADYDTRVLVEDMDPETSLTATLIPDDSLEIALRHNDPSNDPTHGTFWDEIERIEFLHEREGGLSIRAAIEELVGTELLIHLDDGTGDLTITNQTGIDLELEVNHPGDGFIDGFTNPLGWMFAAVQGTDSITVTTADDGSSEVEFGSGSEPTLTFVAADDPADLRFPGDQSNLWPASPPQDWPEISGWRSTEIIRMGLVDGPDGTTIALRANEITDFQFDLAPDSLAQAVTLGAPRGTKLDVDLELEPGAVVSSLTTVACSAELRAGQVGFDIEAPNRFTFLSGGGTELDCQAETDGRRYHAAADEFPATTTVGLRTPTGSGEIDVVAQDDSGSDDPIVGASLIVEDHSGLTGSEPFGEPAKYLALRAASLPSATVGWSRTDADGTALHLESNAIEERLEDVKVILATNDDTMTEPFSRPDGPVTLPLGRTGQPPVFLADDTHSFHLWETPLVSVLAGSVDAARLVEIGVDSTGATRADLETVAPRNLVTELGLPAGGHFMGDTSVVGWCDLKVPGAASGISVDLPLSVGLDTDHPDGFETLECLQRVWTSDGRRLDVGVDGGSLPNGTQMTVDLEQGTANVITGTDRIDHLGIVISDRTRAGLTGATPFSKPIRSLSFRVDDVDTFDASWHLDPAETVVHFEAGPPVGAAQARLSTVPGPDPLAGPGSNHLAQLRDEGGADGDGEIAVRIHDLEGAEVRHVPRSVQPLQVSVDAAQTHPLDVQVFLGFDSAIAPIENGSPLETKVSATISRVRSAVYTTDLQAVHHITGAGGADFDADIVLDETEGDGHSLTIDLAAKDLPDEVGIDGYALFSSEDQNVAIVEMSDELLSLDMVVADSRPTGVRETGSHRIRLHAVHVPARMAFIMTGLEGVEDGVFDGEITVLGELSSPMTRLLIESNRLDGGDEPHLGTPFSQITIDLDDIPRRVEMVISSDVEDNTLEADFLFQNDVNRRGQPILEDRIGGVEILFEKKPRLLDDDRGLFLHPYTQSTFTEVERSPYVTSVDNNYWEADVRDQLDSLDGRGFSLSTGTALQPVAADGAGADVRTRAATDHLIVSAASSNFEDTDINDVRWLALRLEDVHSIEASLEPLRQDVRVVRPGNLGGGPMYVAIEGEDRPSYSAEEVPTLIPEDDRLIDVPDKFIQVEYRDFISGTNEYLAKVLPKDGVDPDTLEITQQPIHGTATVDDGVVHYEPDSADFVGHDVFVFRVCSAEEPSLCAKALGEIVVFERYISGYYAEAASVPADVTIYVDRATVVAPDTSVSFDPTAAGFTASNTLGEVDVLIGPRTLPPVSEVERTRIYVSQSPAELEVDLTEPKAVNAGGKKGLDLALKVKVDSSGGTELVGVSDGPETRVWFGLAGEDIELETQGIGLIRHILTGSRPEKDFRGCDRIFGKIDTCVTLIGLAIEGQSVGDVTRETFSGFVSVSPLAETMSAARNKGAADEEYLPFFTASLTDASELSGNVQLQLEPFCTVQCEAPPFDVDGKLKIKAKDSTLHLWDRGFLGEVVFDAVTTPLSQLASDVTGNPWLLPS